jgi:integrase
MRGSGRVFRPRVRRGATKLWWIDYSLHGQRHREPTGTASKAEAQRLLREKITAREAGRIVGRPDRVVLAEYVKGEDGTSKLVGGLRALAERQYVLDGRTSLDRLQDAFEHLERVIGAETRAPEITATRLDTYAQTRAAEGAARATVNYELAAMRRAFRLGIEKGLLAVMPCIKLSKVDNARSGFFSDGDFAALVLNLPADIASVIRFLRLTGWRRSEALGLTWDQVDRDASIIRLAATDTKGRTARLFPFALAPELKQLLDAQYERRDGPFVFHRHGQRVGVGALDGAWERACLRVGLATKDAETEKVTLHRLVHDLRRTAARDLRRRGLSEGVIMKLCGWKTGSMFDRYNVIDEQDLAESVERAYGQQAANKPGVEQKAEQLS